MNHEPSLQRLASVSYTNPDPRRAFRLAEELTAELQRLEHRADDLIDEWSHPGDKHSTPERLALCTSHNRLMAIRDKAVDIRDDLATLLP